VRASKAVTIVVSVPKPSRSRLLPILVPKLELAPENIELEKTAYVAGLIAR